MSRYGMRAVWAAVIISVVPVLGFAKDVVLTPKNGDPKVEGKLLEFDGEVFRIETKTGPKSINAKTVECSGNGCPTVLEKPQTLDITSQNQLAQTLLEAYAVFQNGTVEITTANAKDPVNVKVRAENGGVVANVKVVQPESGSSYASLAQKKPVLVLSSAKPPAGRESHVIGLDGLVIATSDVNPVDGISLEQMRSVLSGTITNWKELGGGDVPINLHVASGDEGFEQRVEAENLKPVNGLKVVLHPRMKDLSDAVANDPFGIAIVPYSQLRTARAMGLRGSCGMQNMAQEFTLKAGSYPLSYPVYAVHSGRALEPFAQEFVDFLNSEAAQAVLTDFGYADMSIGTRGLESQGQRLANSLIIIGREVPLKDVREMAAVMSGAKRLTTTFRFQRGSKKLDAQSRKNVESLVSGLLLGNYADKTIYLIGFSDGDGRAQANKGLSKDRAEAVLAALNKGVVDGGLGDVDFKILGYGEASPLVCEDSASDRHINRRVEVWVKDAN